MNVNYKLKINKTLPLIIFYINKEIKSTTLMLIKYLIFYFVSCFAVFRDTRQSEQIDNPFFLRINLFTFIFLVFPNRTLLELTIRRILQNNIKFINVLIIKPILIVKIFYGRLLISS